jgi:hypothetical protein
MCQKCLDTLVKHFPDLPEEYQDHFLMEFTAYGFADPETIEEQIASLHKRSKGDYTKCGSLVERDNKRFENWMDRTAHLKEEPDNIFFVKRKSGSKRYLTWERTGKGTQSKYVFHFTKKAEAKAASGRQIDTILKAANRVFGKSKDIESVGHQRVV